MQSGVQSLALDFSEEFANSLQVLGDRHNILYHKSHKSIIRKPDYRRSGAAKNISKDKQKELFHLKNFYNDPLSKLCLRFSVLCKKIMHGGTVCFGNKTYILPGLDNCIANDNNIPILEQYAQEHGYANQKYAFLRFHHSIAHDMAHRIVRACLHIHNAHVRRAIHIVLDHSYSTEAAKFTNMQTDMRNLLAEICRVENLATYDIWDRPMLQLLHDNAEILKAFCMGLLQLGHRVVLWQWCSEWKNKRLMLDLDEGPVRQLLTRYQHPGHKHTYVRIWQSTALASTLHSISTLWCKRLNDKQAKDTISRMTDLDCYMMILQKWFPMDFAQPTIESIKQTSWTHTPFDELCHAQGCWIISHLHELQVTKDDNEKFQQDLDRFALDWNKEEQSWSYLVDDSDYKTKKYDRPQKQLEFVVASDKQHSKSVDGVMTSRQIGNCVPLGPLGVNMKNEETGDWEWVQQFIEVIEWDWHTHSHITKTIPDPEDVDTPDLERQRKEKNKVLWKNDLKAKIAELEIKKNKNKKDKKTLKKLQTEQKNMEKREKNLKKIQQQQIEKQRAKIREDAAAYDAKIRQQKEDNLNNWKNADFETRKKNDYRK